jgi:type I restriction-modification system DNA methylase subunit
VDKERLKDSVGPGRRFALGLPRTDNANYLWIQLFYSALNSKGRSGFVMANSASDARASEQELRQKLSHYGLKSDIARGPKSANVTLATLQCAARIVGRSLRLELV